MIYEPNDRKIVYTDKTIHLNKSAKKINIYGICNLIYNSDFIVIVLLVTIFRFAFVVFVFVFSFGRGSFEDKMSFVVLSFLSLRFWFGPTLPQFFY